MHLVVPGLSCTRWPQRKIAIRSLAPGGGRGLQNFFHSSSGARNAKDEDGITNGPGVTEAILPSKIETSHAVCPTSRRNVVVR